MEAATQTNRSTPSARTSRYVFELATRADDGALRGLLRGTYMNGPLRLSFQREPSFFLGADLGNLTTEIIVGRETSTGALVCTGVRAVRRAFIEGVESPLGYLSGLRLREEVQKSGLLARGYRYLKQLHDAGSTPCYITTILDGNEEARRILTSGRAGLPAYVSYGRLRTYMLPLYGFRKRIRSAAVTRGATKETLPAAVACLNRFNADLQFAPAYRVEDFDANSGRLRGLSAEDLYLRLQGPEVVGTLAVWNQNGFKQSVVVGYSRGLALARPALTFAAKFGLAPRLPRAGRSLPCLYAGLIGCRGSDAAVFQELVDTVLADWTNTGYAYLLLGLCDRHPFSPIVERRSVMAIDSGIYLVCWPDSKPDPLPSTSRVPHLEVATL